MNTVQAESQNPLLNAKSMPMSPYAELKAFVEQQDSIKKSNEELKVKQKPNKKVQLRYEKAKRII